MLLWDPFEVRIWKPYVTRGVAMPFLRWLHCLEAASTAVCLGTHGSGPVG